MQGLKRILERFGLKQTELAKLLDVSPRTVSLWATGEVAVPGPVRGYLRVLQAAGPDVVAAEIGRLDGHRKMFDDGLYSLTYAGRGVGAGPPGDAVAVLRAGRILGSDRAGGLFEGSYRFDTATETNHVHMRLRVPPDGELVTGLHGGANGANVEVVAALERPAPVASATIDVGGQPLDLTMTYLGPLPA